MPNSRTLLLLLLLPALRASPCDTWYDSTTHGWSFRNASAFGAVGDGVTDSTAALQAAIDFQRGGEAGSGADKSAALIYVPPGRYVITDTIVLWKWTKLVGNTKCPPTLVLPARTPAFAGADGLRPLLVTVDGANSSTAAHDWWVETGIDATNENFFTQLHHFTIEVGAGNPGAVGIMWNVAQQTSVRDVSCVCAADTAVCLDVGTGPDYEHFNSGAAFSLGGGGVIDDVRVHGGVVGVRVAAAQFLISNMVVTGATDVGLRVWQLAWSLVFHNVSIAGAPLAVDVHGALDGSVSFLDASFSGVAGGTAIATGGSALLLQNARADSSVHWVVDTEVARPADGVVAAWVRGPVFINGVARAGTSGVLALPTLAAAAAQKVPLACGGRLCGGSAEDPRTGVPYSPIPDFSDDAGVLNALDAGARGDGVTDDTTALNAALAASRTVFIPFGIYMISDTLKLRNDSRVVGEGLTVIRLAPNSISTASSRPVIAVPEGAHVAIADISLWNADCGNEGAVMIAWAAAADSTMHDVNMLLSGTVDAKAVVLGGGAGVFSNMWWPATMSFQPTTRTDARRTPAAATAARAVAALPSHAVSARANVARAVAASADACPYTSTGTVVGSAGPLFWLGVNFEHATGAELLFVQGATNQVVLGLQTEEAPIALVLNQTLNVVVFNVLGAFWNASQTSPAQAVAQRDPSRVVRPGDADLAYRVHNLGVPIDASEDALFIDVDAYDVPLAGARGAYALGAALLNIGDGKALSK